MFFAVLFARRAVAGAGRRSKTILAVCEGLSEVMFKFTMIVMAFAPIGIGAAIAVTVGQSGLGVLLNLGMLVVTLYGALIVFILLVLLPVALLVQGAAPPLRARGEGAVADRVLDGVVGGGAPAARCRRWKQIGVPRRIVAFVLPTGYSFNLDGSTLYLALASVFVAQAAGIRCRSRTQLVMMLTLMLTSKGVAAVPRASLVILSGALAQFGLPLEGVAVILGVDALMDMARTSTTWSATVWRRS